MDLKDRPEPATAAEAFDQVASESDARTSNNTVRHNYRVLTDAEKAGMVAIKDAGQALIDAITAFAPAGREQALGVTNAEQAVMWAVKGLTR